jgi:uncharacterized protein
LPVAVLWIATGLSLLPMNFKLSYYTVFTDVPKERTTASQIIAYSTRTGLAMLMNQQYVEDIRESKYDNIPSDLVETLIEKKILVPEFENEFEVCLEENKAFIKDVTVLSYTIQPTGNCQLGCHYCGQKHRNAVMSQEVLDKTFARIKNIVLKGKYKGMSITWYGGEPLMGLKEIKYLSGLLIEFCKSEKINYSADIITNGMALTPDKHSLLVEECKITTYQITVDGLPEHHNSNRPTKLGKDTFHTIFSNIKNFVSSQVFQDHKCAFALRMNINRFNSEGIPAFIDYLTEQGLSGKVRLDFVGIMNWGDNKAAENSLSTTEFSEKKVDWMFYAMTKGFSFGELLPKRQHAPCMVVDNNSEVFDAYGNIYPCYELPYTPVHEKGANLIGNLLTGVEKPPEEVPLRNWNDRVKEGAFGCKTCRFFPVCGGGCPKSWLAGEVPCPSFKFNMPELLLLEYVNNRQRIAQA